RLEVVRPERADRTALLPVRAEHEVIDEQLAAAVEEISQRLLAVWALEDVLLLDRLPGKALSLLRQLVACACELLLLGEQLLARPPSPSRTCGRGGAAGRARRTRRWRCAPESRRRGIGRRAADRARPCSRTNATVSPGRQGTPRPSPGSRRSRALARPSSQSSFPRFSSSFSASRLSALRRSSQNSSRNSFSSASPSARAR